MVNTRIKTLCLLVCLAIFSFNGCKASYPKEKIAESLQKVLKKEYNIDGKVELKSTTLYLDIMLQGLTTTEVKALTDVLKTVQSAMLTITRVALSSDAKIEYLVVNIKDPAWKLNLKLVQRLEDVKSLLYQRISRTDYEGRFILEIEKNETPVITDLAERTPWSMDEFIGRLIVSQVNMVNRTNPFLSILLNNAQLQYKGFVNNELLIGISGNLGDKTLPFFKQMLVEKSKEVIKKYSYWNVKLVRVVDKNDKVISTEVMDKADILKMPDKKGSNKFSLKTFQKKPR